MIAKTKPRVIIEAVVHRNDGTTENLGVICDSKKRNIFQNIMRKVKKNG
jgi:hypothetical protein